MQAKLMQVSFALPDSISHRSTKSTTAQMRATTCLHPPSSLLMERKCHLKVIIKWLSIRLLIAVLVYRVLLDRVDREALWKVLLMYDVEGSLLRMVNIYNRSSRACVRVGQGESDWLEVNVGL